MRHLLMSYVFKLESPVMAAAYATPPDIMAERDSLDGSIESAQHVKLSSSFLSRLRRPCPSDTAPGQPSSSGKPLVSEALVQRLRHENYRMELVAVISQPDAVPRVDERVGLSHWTRRAHNSLRSREMLLRQAADEHQTRLGSSSQVLAQDISRRHFRTKHLYDTGSKYPDLRADPATHHATDEMSAQQPALHGPQAREPLLTLLQSRKLCAIAEAVLALPMSHRVGGEGQEGAAGGVSSFGGGTANAGTLDGLSSKLQATMYALARFEQASGHDVPQGQCGEAGDSVGGAGREMDSKDGRSPGNNYVSLRAGNRSSDSGSGSRSGSSSGGSSSSSGSDSSVITIGAGVRQGGARDASRQHAGEGLAWTRGSGEEADAAPPYVDGSRTTIKEPPVVGNTAAAEPDACASEPGASGSGGTGAGGQGEGGDVPGGGIRWGNGVAGTEHLPLAVQQQLLCERLLQQLTEAQWLRVRAEWVLSEGLAVGSGGSRGTGKDGVGSEE